MLILRKIKRAANLVQSLSFKYESLRKVDLFKAAPNLSVISHSKIIGSQKRIQKEMDLEDFKKTDRPLYFVQGVLYNL